MPRCAGIDQGYSHMGLALVAASGEVLARARTTDPPGDGHDRGVALARLRRLLADLDALRGPPVRLAGYCYEDSGVEEAFAAAGWSVEGTKALNDVMGVYGLTDMPGHVLVASCGTFSQVVYVDARQAVRWPGDDLAAQLPEWPLSGERYAHFLTALVRDRGAEGLPEGLRRAARAVGASDLAPGPQSYGVLGPMLSEILDHPAARAFAAAAADALIATRDVLWRESGLPEPPALLVGGGAVGDNRLWRALADRLHHRGATASRAAGDPAVGLARFALAHPDADPWAVIGKVRPEWLS